MMEKWEESVDNDGAFDSLMTELTKAFDCLPHQVFIANLDSLKFQYSSVVPFFVDEVDIKMVLYLAKLIIQEIINELEKLICRSY